MPRNSAQVNDSWLDWPGQVPVASDSLISVAFAKISTQSFGGEIYFSSLGSPEHLWTPAHVREVLNHPLIRPRMLRGLHGLWGGAVLRLLESFMML